LNIEVAKRVKKKFPKCTIVFGGPQVPFEAGEFFAENPFIDITTRGEGELTFQEILLGLPERRFEDISGISFRDKYGNCVKNNIERTNVKDLDSLASPYLDGSFEKLIREHPEIKFQAIIETNRGCPYSCSYCCWSQGGLSKKFRFHSIERIGKIAEWCGENKIEYVFCADSNFGVFKRDLEIAKKFVDVKSQFKYPEKFRVCYAKNAEETVFEIGKLLHQHEMEKGITLSRQSNNPEALANIGRKNIKMSMFNKLQRGYNQLGIPTYTELILGLPGETYTSFVEGLEEILRSGIQSQLMIYPCQVYKNTQLGDSDYQKSFGIQASRSPINEVHGLVRPEGLITEYEYTVTSTSSLPQADWKKAMALSLTIQLFHGLKVGFYIMSYLASHHNLGYTGFLQYLLSKKDERTPILSREIKKFYGAAESTLQGNSRSRIMPEFGNIYWEQEEGSFLDLVGEKDKFYKEMKAVTEEFLKSKGKKVNPEELEEVIKYQEARIPVYTDFEDKEFHFKFNIPEYFEGLSVRGNASLEQRSQVMTLRKPIKYQGDKKAFATNIILRGRKNNKIPYIVDWRNV
jgi:putative methyltransferase